MCEYLNETENNAGILFFENKKVRLFNERIKIYSFSLNVHHEFGTSPKKSTEIKESGN